MFLESAPKFFLARAPKFLKKALKISGVQSYYLCRHFLRNTMYFWTTACPHI